MIIPYESLLEIFKYFDPIDLLLTVRPASKLFKKMANTIIHKKLFLDSEIEVQTFSSSRADVPAPSHIRCALETDTADADILAWVGDASCIVSAFDQIPLAPKPIFLIAPRPWAWFKPVNHNYGKLYIQDLVFMHRICDGASTVLHQSEDEITIQYPPWTLRYRRFVDNARESICRLTVQIPTFVLVKLSFVYRSYWRRWREWQPGYLIRGSEEGDYFAYHYALVKAYNQAGESNAQEFPVIRDEIFEGKGCVRKK